MFVHLGEWPVVLECPVCERRVTTRVSRSIRMSTHLMALCCCVIGCFPLAVLPYCLGGSYRVRHYCPLCGALLGHAWD
ncbi:lipopolysaccharide-induced tumor necrosis factor-alpha factor homolog [Bacillus rossius redtenbacheri]|uniref:lipopolysaccharide-induced tumor necrosis factor-alpha factor homolog n=1 Tax=Bacillus rossius redtenbacheri TaxID=93214 RepID=UPI002FDDC1CE